MKSDEASAEIATPRILPGRAAAERVIWPAIACLVGALLVLRWNAAPGQDPVLAKLLALALFATIYALIRVRESGGRL